MNRLKKITAWTLVTLATIAVAFVAVVLVRSQRTFDAPYPQIQASTEPAVIERGRYLVYGPAHCVACHTPNEQEDAIKAGATPPLIGGHKFELPFGNVYGPNLTPDKETGIGRYTDGELARTLRHGVMPGGRAAIPFMEFQHLSDEDLTAVISFLRAEKPVRNAVPDNELNFIGKAVMAFAMEPVGPSRPLLAKTPAEGTMERGEYLATSVANCAACHTKRNLVTGEFISARFAGGMEFDVPGDEDRLVVSPNLTPSKTGRITNWDEEQFLGRFAAGVGIRQSHMPWRQFQKMSESDLRSIYRYLKTLQPVENDPGPSLQVKKKGKKA